jgi:hypothetical protein
MCINSVDYLTNECNGISFFHWITGSYFGGQSYLDFDFVGDEAYGHFS